MSWGKGGETGSNLYLKVLLEKQKKQIKKLEINKNTSKERAKRDFHFQTLCLYE